MTTIVVPERAYSHPLREALRRAPNERDFRNQVALTAAFTRAMRQVSNTRKMTIRDLLDALLTNITSCVQAKAEPSEWAEVAAVLADELRSRLTVTGDSGNDDHARRWA